MAEKQKTPMKGSKDAETAMALEDYRANIAEASERMHFQVEYSQSALKNLNLVNGGAIVALLTFIGNTNHGFDAYAMKFAFGWFSAGLGFSLLAYFGAFFSQFFFMNVPFSDAWNAQAVAHGEKVQHSNQKDYKFGNLTMGAGIALATLSCLAFVIGSFVALDGLS